MKKSMKIIRRACALGIGLFMLLTCTPVHAAESSICPPDIPAEAWYAHYATLCEDVGIMETDKDGLFRPNNILSVAELIVMTARLWNMTGEHDEDIFSSDPLSEIWVSDDVETLVNVNSASYQDAIQYVCQRAHGALSHIEERLKKDGCNGISSPATRGDICNLLGGSMHSPIYRREWSPEADSLQFCARNMYMTGIMEGTGNSFELEKPLSRREAAAFFARYLYPELRNPSEPHPMHHTGEIAKIELSFGSFGHIFLELKLNVLDGVLWIYEMESLENEEDDYDVYTDRYRSEGRDPNAENEGYQTCVELSKESLSDFMSSGAMRKVLTWGSYYEQAYTFDGLQWWYTFTFLDNSEWSVYGSNAYPDGWDEFWDAFAELAGLPEQEYL